MAASGGETAAAANGAAPAAGQAAAAAAAESFKEQGNEEYRGGRWLKAAALYTQGLKADPDNAVLYSNRSAALLQLSKTTKAVADAEQCIRLRPDWDRGYSRKAAVLEVLGRLEEALEMYQAASKCNKESKQLAEKVRMLTKIVQQQGKQCKQAAAPQPQS